MPAAVAIHTSVSSAGPIPIAAALPRKPRAVDGANPPKSKSMNVGKEASNARGRRERPCDACRKRKSRCVIDEKQIKNCVACELHGQDCTYNEDPQPRKRRLDSQGQEIETPKRRSTTSQLPRQSAMPHASTSSTSMPKSAFLPTANLEKYTFQNRAYSTHVGHTTELEPILFDLSAPGSNPMVESSYQKRDEHTAFLVRQLGLDSSRQSKSHALRDMEKLVNPHGPALMRTYQSTIHQSYPIVEDELFHHYESNMGNDVDPALLSAMYCLAMPCLAREVGGSLAPALDIIRLEDAAFKSFGESLCQPTLSTIQAGLLLMQRPNIDSKTLNTQLVGIAYELGLHLDCSSWSVSGSERSLRTRLAWALYMQDKWCSLIHGRPSSISGTNWAVQTLKEADFAPPAKEADGESDLVEIDGQALFTQMVGLTEILSDVLETFYTLQAMREVEDAGQNGTRLILERAKPVQIKLKEWFARLPADLKMDSSTTGKPLCTGYLHLAYFATEITLHRCIIRSLNSTNADSYLSHICRSAAKTRLISAMDFVNRLRLDHLHSFWYFPSKVNFALIGTFGSLLLATAPYQEEVDFYRTRLSEYRWTLGVSSKSADFLVFAAESLDASSSLLKSLPEKPSTSDASVLSSSAKSTQSPSPPVDEAMADAPSLHLGQLPVFPEAAPLEPGGRSSGLVSPSTSTSSGSTTYDAYVEEFANRAGESSGYGAFFGQWGLHGA